MVWVKYTRRLKHWYEIKWGKKIEPVSAKTADPSDFEAIMGDEKEEKPTTGAGAKLLKLLKLKIPTGGARTKEVSLTEIKEVTNEEASLE